MDSAAVFKPLKPTEFQSLSLIGPGKTIATLKVSAAGASVAACVGAAPAPHALNSNAPTSKMEPKKIAFSLFNMVSCSFVNRLICW
jgi:hypothetical protein